MTVHEFLYALDPRAVWPGFMTVILAASAAIAIPVVAPKTESVWTGRLIRSGAAAILALAAFQSVVAGWYLVYPSYLDYVEPETAAVAWLGWHGSPIYPPLASGDLYAQVYGPVLFQGTGLFLLLLGPSIAISKIPGLAVFVAAQVLTYLLLRRGGGRPAEALTITAVQCLVQAGFGNQAYAFGVRADPWLFALAAASTLVATATPSAARAVILGCLAGIAVNLKADAALYIAPVTVLFLCRTATFAGRAKLAALGVGAAMIAFALPFMTGDAAILDYVNVLEFSAHRTFSQWLTEQGVVMIVLQLGALLWIYRLCRPTLPRGFIPFITATVICMSVVLLPASREGAGPHHFLPFLPSLSWAFLVLFRASRQGVDGKARASLDWAVLGMIAALVVGYGPIAAQSWDFILRRYATAPLARTAAAEVVSALDQFPGLKISVGPGWYGNFDVASMRAIPVFRGNPLPIDPVTWTEYQYSGASEAIIRRILDECRVDIWLLRHGAPFEANNSYTGKSMFSQAILDEFHRHYTLLAAGQVYDEWRCNRAGPLRSP